MKTQKDKAEETQHEDIKTETNDLESQSPSVKIHKQKKMLSAIAQFTQLTQLKGTNPSLSQVEDPLPMNLPELREMGLSMSKLAMIISKDSFDAEDYM